MNPDLQGFNAQQGTVKQAARQSLASDSQQIRQISGFLASIGIEVIETELPADTFLPGCTARGSCVLIDRSRLKYPGDMLHEAGHIAVTKPAQRKLIGAGETAASFPNGGEELAAMLWSYAACCAMNLDAAVVFHADGYNGDAAWLLENYRAMTFIGLPFLAWMGMCDADEFPAVKCWLRPAAQK